MEAKVVLLADRPGLIPALAVWFARVWEPYYGPDGPGDAMADLQAGCQKDQLPIYLVAMSADGKALGTASLKDLSAADRPDLGPWLTALAVPPEHAGQGVAELLVAAIEDEAKRLGQSAIYCDANTDETLKSPSGWEEVDAFLLANRGWARIGTADSLRGPTAIYKCVLNAIRSHGPA
ncbi:MAG: GNAT family N-acetyltransferase [Alphaproteobacteria bacterium]